MARAAVARAVVVVAAAESTSHKDFTLERVQDHRFCICALAGFAVCHARTEYAARTTP